MRAAKKKRRRVGERLSRRERAGGRRERAREILS